MLADKIALKLVGKDGFVGKCTGCGFFVCFEERDMSFFYHDGFSSWKKLLTDIIRA